MHYMYTTVEANLSKSEVGYEEVCIFVISCQVRAENGGWSKVVMSKMTKFRLH